MENRNALGYSDTLSDKIGRFINTLPEQQKFPASLLSLRLALSEWGAARLYVENLPALWQVYLFFSKGMELSFKHIEDAHSEAVKYRLGELATACQHLKNREFIKAVRCSIQSSALARGKRASNDRLYDEWVRVAKARLAF